MFVVPALDDILHSIPPEGGTTNIANSATNDNPILAGSKKIWNFLLEEIITEKQKGVRRSFSELLK